MLFSLPNWIFMVGILLAFLFVLLYTIFNKLVLVIIVS